MYILIDEIDEIDKTDDIVYSLRTGQRSILKVMAWQ